MLNDPETEIHLLNIEPKKKYSLAKDSPIHKIIRIAFFIMNNTSAILQ